MADRFRPSRDDEEHRKFDSWAHAVSVIATEHRNLHDGFCFTCTHVDRDVPDGERRGVLIDVPSGEIRPHLRKQVAYFISARGGPFGFPTHGPDGPVRYSFHEGPTIDGSLGTPLPAYNNNRSSPKEAYTQFYANPPVVLGYGTELETEIHALASTGGESKKEDLAPEWDLSTGARYMLCAMNETGQPIDISWYVFIYEVDYPPGE